MKHLIDKLRSNRRLNAEEYKALLLSRDIELAAYLQELAREEALARFGNKIFIRGLIEITNHCRNNCYYCGIRKENRNIVRYELAQEEILSCCHEGYRGKPTNVSSWQVPTAICYGTKPATKGTIASSIRRRCPFPTGYNVWSG